MKMCGTDNARVMKSSLPQGATQNGSGRQLENDTRTHPSHSIINLDHGDPMLFESYWQKMGDECTFTIAGYQSLSYFSNVKNLCWFLEPKLEEEIRRLHQVVGNASTNDHFIVVGNGSSQLIQAALFALSTLENRSEPINVISAAPFYSAYSEVTDFLCSRLYKWAGDARTYDNKKPYIEFVTSPNNPNGVMQKPVVNGEQGKHIHDLAYYWPQYTPITSLAEHDIMLFTISKCSGHAGSRIGWALVKDKEVAKKMTKFIAVSTVGVSKESQLRAAKIIGVISDSCQRLGSCDLPNLFEYGQNILIERWKKLREAVKLNGNFSLPKYPMQYCHFTGQKIEAHPAFAWLKCKRSEEDCEKIFKEYKILTRSGKRFGSDSSWVRVSMVSKNEEFNLFLERLSTIRKRQTCD